MLSKYAVANPTYFDRISIVLEKPSLGWIDVCFKVNERQTASIEFSSVYETFMPLKEWMEDIVEKSEKFSYGISMVDINCECYHVILYYEPILFYDWKISRGKNCGLLYMYDEAEGKIIFDAFCETDEVLKKFYTAILDYAKAMQQDSHFIKEWVWEAYNEEVAELKEDSVEMKVFFYNKIKSRIVEEFLQLENNECK